MRVDTVVGRLSVEVVGEGSAALLWHSLFIDATQWGRIREVLGGHRTLVLVDGPGHGSSGPPPRRFTLSDCANAGRQVLDALSLPAVDWVGTAWGGHVGIVFAATHPDRCRTLAAIAAPIQPLSTGERARIGSLVVAYRLVGPVRPLTQAVVDALLGPAGQQNPELVDLVRTAFIAADRGGMSRAMRSVMLRRPDLSDVLRRVAAPTVLIAGDQDPLWTPAQAQAAAALSARATAATVSGGHSPPLEAPAEVSRLLLGLWQPG